MKVQIARFLLLGLIQFLVGALMPGLAGAATRYVAPAGNDAYPGTEAQPWLTLQKAAASVQPGDLVRIKAGEYFVAPTWRVHHAGTAELPITYRAYGDGEVRITNATILPSGAWTHVKGGTYSTPINQPAMSVFRGALPLHGPADRVPGEEAKFIHGIDQMIPNSFFVSGKTLYVWLEDSSDPKVSVMRATPGHTISLYNCHYTTFDGLTVEYGLNGIKQQGAATHHITIRNCVIRSIGGQGIQPVPPSCIIEHNLFQKIGSTKYEHGIYGSQPGSIIRNNIFEEITGAGIHQFHESSPPAGGRCEFYGNVFRKPRRMTRRSRPSSGNYYYVDIIAWGDGNNDIHDNLFYDEGKRSAISLNSPGNQVERNTFAGSTYGVQFFTGKPGNQVRYNTFQDATRSFVIWPRGAQPQILDDNRYTSAGGSPRWEREGVSYRDFSAWQQAAGEAHSCYGDPALVNPATPPGSSAGPESDQHGAAVVNERKAGNQ